MRSLSLALAQVIEEHVAPFVKESREALAEDAAGRGVRVVPLEPLLVRVVAAVVKVVVSHLAEELGGGRIRNKHVCSCGGGLLHKVTRPRTWGSVVGELVLVRSYHRCGECGATRYPLDVVWGLRPEEVPAKGREYLTPAASRCLVLTCVIPRKSS